MGIRAVSWNLTFPPLLPAVFLPLLRCLGAACRPCYILRRHTSPPPCTLKPRLPLGVRSLPAAPARRFRRTRLPKQLTTAAAIAARLRLRTRHAHLSPAPRNRPTSASTLLLRRRRHPLQLRLGRPHRLPAPQNPRTTRQRPPAEIDHRPRRARDRIRHRSRLLARRRRRHLNRNLRRRVRLPAAETLRAATRRHRRNRHRSILARNRHRTTLRRKTSSRRNLRRTRHGALRALRSHDRSLPLARTETLALRIAPNRRRGSDQRGQPSKRKLHAQARYARREAPSSKKIQEAET